MHFNFTALKGGVRMGSMVADKTPTDYDKCVSEEAYTEVCVCMRACVCVYISR